MADLALPLVVVALPVCVQHGTCSHLVAGVAGGSVGRCGRWLADRPRNLGCLASVVTCWRGRPLVVEISQQEGEQQQQPEVTRHCRVSSVGERSCDCCCLSTIPETGFSGRFDVTCCQSTTYVKPAILATGKTAHFGHYGREKMW